MRGSTIRSFLLPDALNLDALLVEEKQRAKTQNSGGRIGAAAGGGGIGRGRGRGRGMGRGRGR